MLTTALLRTQLTGVVPALTRPLAATAPGLGGVESFGRRAPSGLKTGEAETLLCVCGVIPQRIAGRAISSAHPPHTSSTPVPTNEWACLCQQPMRTLRASGHGGWFGGGHVTHSGTMRVSFEAFVGPLGIPSSNTPFTAVGVLQGQGEWSNSAMLFLD